MHPTFFLIFHFPLRTLFIDQRQSGSFELISWTIAMHLRSVSLHPENYPTRDHYPFNLRIFERTRSIHFSAPITFLIGENGTGKSTLLQAISRKCGIHIWEGFERTRYAVNPYEKDLFKAIDIEWTNGTVTGSFFASEIFQHFSQLLDEWASADPGVLDYFGGHSLLSQSHGQSLLSYFRARYKIKGLYLLDEPETALSPKSQLEFLQLLAKMSSTGDAQFIIATHSPVLLACPDAVILSFDHIPIRQVAYTETDYYNFFKEFMNNRESYLKGLASE
jgi:predicted ATPase